MDELRDRRIAKKMREAGSVAAVVKIILKKLGPMSPM